MSKFSELKKPSAKVKILNLISYLVVGWWNKGIVYWLIVRTWKRQGYCTHY